MKKKLGIIMILLTMVMMLVGCGAKPQSQFLDQLEKMSDTKNNAGSFDMSISDFELADVTGQTTNDPMIGMVMSQIKSMKLKANYQLDSKNPEIFEVKMSINVMGMEVPMDMLGNMGEKPAMYMSADMFVSVLELVQAFGNEYLPEVANLGELKGKYLDLIELGALPDTKLSKSDVQEMEVAKEFMAAYQKEVRKYMESLDSKLFTKKDDTISHKVTKDELLEIIKLAQKVAKSDKKFAEFASEENLTDVFKDFNDFSMTIKVDTKKNTTKMKVLLVPTEEISESAGFKKISFDISMKAESNDKTVKLPSKKEIVTEEQMEALFSEPEAEYTLDDADFKELIDGIKEVKDDLDQETKDSLLDAYKDYVTEKQYKQLEKILKK